MAPFLSSSTPPSSPTTTITTTTPLSPPYLESVVHVGGPGQGGPFLVTINIIITATIINNNIIIIVIIINNNNTALTPLPTKCRACRRPRPTWPLSRHHQHHHHHHYQQRQQQRRQQQQQHRSHPLTWKVSCMSAAQAKVAPFSSPPTSTSPPPPPTTTTTTTTSLSPPYLESAVHVGGPGQGGPFLVPVGGLDEVSGGGGDVGLLRVVGQLDLVLRHQEDHLADVLVRRLARVALELHHHPLCQGTGGLVEFSSSPGVSPGTPVSSSLLSVYGSADKIKLK